MWRKGNPLALFVGMQIDTVTLEKCSGLVTKLCLTLGTPWTGVHPTSLSTGFSRQEYWSGMPFSPPGDLPDPGIELRDGTQVYYIFHIGREVLYA